MDLAKHDDNVDLQLECSWRVSDWNAEKETLGQHLTFISDHPTPRHKVFEAFFNLTQIQESPEKHNHVQKLCDEGIQLLLTQWHRLPSLVYKSHIPHLHLFQQFVEIQEASQIYTGLANNKMQLVQELKGTLGTWRDR